MPCRGSAFASFKNLSQACSDGWGSSTLGKTLEPGPRIAAPRSDDPGLVQVMFLAEGRDGERG